MSESLYGVVEVGLAFALILGLAIWQLIAVKRSIRRDKAEAEARRANQADPP